VACTLPDHGLSHGSISHSIRRPPSGGFTEAAQKFPTSPHRLELGFPRCSPASDRPDASVANMASIRMRAGKFVLARFATIVGPSRSI
jgi:hypothetical protein